jgi:hypothetical protein
VSTVASDFHRSYRPRWWELIPEALLLIGLGYFFADETDAATGAFKSARAVTLMIAGAVGWVTARLLLARFVPWPTARLVPLLVASAAILAVVVLPAYRTNTVIERLGADPIPTSDAGIDGSTRPPAGDTEATATPMLVRAGSFRGIDHRARGTVAVYRRVDGSHVIGLEDFDIQPGPDYDVYVVRGADRTDRDDGTRLDDLRGNAGTQYYDTPAGIDLEIGPWTVLVWCQTFGVPVANATPV